MNEDLLVTILGFITGAVVTFLIFYFLIKIIRKKTGKKGFTTQYDERQELARGKAFKYAFFTEFILNLLALLWFGFDSESISALPQVFLSILMISLLVFVSCAIWNNAYIGINETYRSSVILIGVVAITNIVIGITVPKTADISVAFINLSLGILLAVICIEMIAKNIYDKHNEGSDEE